jgi:hypothetical protein
VVFSFFKRLFSQPPPSPEIESPRHTAITENEPFRTLAAAEGGIFYENFSFFYQDRHHRIDFLLFLPYQGIFFGEKHPWSYRDLENSRAERSLKQSKKSPSTHLESTETALRRKLEDILSFDSTVCKRLLWLNQLSEEEFDTLDVSFHTLLPKERVIFRDTDQSALRTQLGTLAPKLTEPYSPLKTIGTLQSHTLILPNSRCPQGAFLCDEQQRFLETDYRDCTTALFGEYNSGKSTLLVRKVLLTLLTQPKERILIVTPTLVSGELFRDELISLIEYGFITCNLSGLAFSTPEAFPSLGESELYRRATMLICDDAYAMEPLFIEALKQQRGNRWLLLSMHDHYSTIGDSAVFLTHEYQKNIPYAKIPASKEKAIMTLLLELRQNIASGYAPYIMVVCAPEIALADFKEAIDEYFDINARIVTKEFSLQYRTLNDLIITTVDNAYGIHRPHVYGILPEDSADYSFTLSRASETATIISF